MEHWRCRRGIEREVLEAAIVCGRGPAHGSTRSVPGAAVRERPNLLGDGDTRRNSGTDLFHQHALRSQRRGVSGGRGGNTPRAARWRNRSPWNFPDDNRPECSPWNTGASLTRDRTRSSRSGHRSLAAVRRAREHAECSRSGRQGATSFARRRGHPEKLADRSLPPTRSKIPTPRGERRPRREHSACGSMAQSFHGKQTSRVNACSHRSRGQRGITFAILPRSPSETAPTSSNPAGIDPFVQIQISPELTSHGDAISSARSGGARARTSATSNPTSGALSMDSRRTSTPSPSSRTTCRRKWTRRSRISTRTMARSGRAIAIGTPGKPAPLPRSTTRAPSGSSGAADRESST